MKLYTEEQVVDFTMNVIHQYEFGNKKMWWDKELLIELIQYVTPIELPSDEDIEEQSWGYREVTKDMEIPPNEDWSNGAKWMRDKITNIK